MNLRINYGEEKTLNIDFTNEYMKVESAIDSLWSDEKNAWVKKPMQINDEQIEEIMMTAIAAQDTCGLFVVIGESREFLGGKAIIDAIGTKLGTAPEMIFLDESLSSVEIRKALEKMRHYEINGCVLSKGGQRKEILATYDIFNEYMQNRYGAEVGARRIMIITAEEESPLAKRGREAGSGVFSFFSEEESYYNVFNYTSLLIMAIAGVEIKRFVAGAEVMATDSVWDIDGGNLAIVLEELAKEINLIGFSQKNFAAFSRWLSLVLSDKRKNRIFISADKTVDDYTLLYENLLGETCILDVGTASLDENIKLKEKVVDFGEDNINDLKKSILGERYSFDENSIEKLVKIWTDNANAFELGQMIYYFMMIASICKLM